VIDGQSTMNIRHLEDLCNSVEMLPAPSKKLGFSMIIRLLCSLISVQPYTIWRHYSRKYLERVHKLIKIKKFDLIHCDILPLSYTVRKLSQIPCVITDHDVSYLKTLRMAKNSRNIFMKLFLFLEALKMKRLESNIFRHVHMGIAVSHTDKQHLKRLCPEAKFEVIENGVNTDEFCPDFYKIEDKMLLWIGGFGHYPNEEAIFYFLDKIYPLIKKEVSGIKINLIGNNVTNRLRRFEEEDPSINFLGFVEDPVAHLRKAAVFIAPILSGSGIKLKMLEAMAVGKAIVTTSIGCEGIEAINGEHYIVADKPEDFAKNVVALLDDDKKRYYLSTNVRQLSIQKYDWKKIIAKVDNIYKSIVEKTK